MRLIIEVDCRQTLAVDVGLQDEAKILLKKNERRPEGICTPCVRYNTPKTVKYNENNLNSKLNYYQTTFVVRT